MDFLNKPSTYKPCNSCVKVSRILSYHILCALGEGDILYMRAFEYDQQLKCANYILCNRKRTKAQKSKYYLRHKPCKSFKLVVVIFSLQCEK